MTDKPDEELKPPSARGWKALREDPASARAEWLAEFRVDVEQFVALETVEAHVEPGVCVRPFSSRFRYRAFVDPSGEASTR